MGSDDIEYQGKVAIGVPHPFGWMWRTADDLGDPRRVLAGTAGLPPAIWRPSLSGADERSATAGVPIAEAEGEGKPQFIAMASLMELCPRCEGDPAAAIGSEADDFEDRLDWGDADLRQEAEQEASAAGWWRAGDGQWYAPLRTGAAASGCPRCTGLWGDGEQFSAPLVPALPLDVQPAAWLRELCTEVAERVRSSTEASAATRMRWDIVLELVNSLLADLPDVAPEAWWPDRMLASEVEGVAAAREQLKHVARAVEELPFLPLGSDDDVPF